MLKMIAAVGKNLELGANNALMWHLPEDMRFFREMTKGFSVIMGRKTFESIGKPLPKRRNLVITRNPDFSAEGVEIFFSLEKALEAVKGEDAYIIGGASVYAEGLKYADEIILTEIDRSFPGADVFFPKFDKSRWKREIVGEGEDGGISYTFVRYSGLYPLKTEPAAYEWVHTAEQGLQSEKKQI